jgi:hypothetical protein
MMTAIKGLAIVLGLFAYQGDHAAAWADPEPAQITADWYPPTEPRPDTAELDAVAAARPGARVEVHHEEYRHTAQPRLLPLPAIRAAWRSQMGWWLDQEYLAWRELLHSYPMPEEG